jgi:hypothetical protein
VTGDGIAFVADASHTLNFFIDPVGSGFSYRTASGYQYLTSFTAPPEPTPVPEPATAILVFSGVAGLVGRHRFRRGR